MIMTALPRMDESKNKRYTHSREGNQRWPVVRQKNIVKNSECHEACPVAVFYIQPYGAQHTVSTLVDQTTCIRFVAVKFAFLDCKFKLNLVTEW